jgi:DNA repair exonuclease SbcCD ATPase subunit
VQKTLKEEKERLEEQLRDQLIVNDKLENEIKDWIATAENNSIMVNSLEQKVKQISAEKRDYELLLTRVHAVMSDTEMQSIISEIMRILRELHITLRDKNVNEQDIRSSVEDAKDNTIPEYHKAAQLNVQCERLRAQLGTLQSRYIEILNEKLVGYNKPGEIYSARISYNIPLVREESLRNTQFGSTAREKPSNSTMNEFSQTLSNVIL